MFQGQFIGFWEILQPADLEETIRRTTDDNVGWMNVYSYILIEIIAADMIRFARMISAVFIETTACQTAIMQFGSFFSA